MTRTVVLSVLLIVLAALFVLVGRRRRDHEQRPGSDGSPFEPSHGGAALGDRAAPSPTDPGSQGIHVVDDGETSLGA